jgi:hypothetical protein
MVHPIPHSITDPRQLTQVVLQITTLLDLYQAELARILHLQCSDIGFLSNGKACLEPNTTAWQQAELFVRFYHALYEMTQGDGVAMRQWLRVEQKEVGGIPHLLMVDNDRLHDIVEILEQQAII